MAALTLERQSGAQASALQRQHSSLDSKPPCVSPQVPELLSSVGTLLRTLPHDPGWELQSGFRVASSTVFA